VTAKEVIPAKLPFSEVALAKTLRSLASVLLRLGINAPTAEGLLRASYVHAAAALARAQSSRATQSQIATLAGVNRLDVRRLLGTKSRRMTQGPTKDRMEYVLAAWRSDAAFRDRRGHPRPLNFTGRNSELAKLVKKYGRDVSTNAVRLQLIRMGAAQEKLGKLVLTSPGVRRTGDSISARADLRFLEKQLRAFQLQAGRRAYVIKSTAVYVNDKRTAKRLQKTTLEKIRLMLAGLQSVAQLTHMKDSQHKRLLHRVIVTATVATESGGFVNGKEE